MGGHRVLGWRTLPGQQGHSMRRFRARRGDVLASSREAADEVVDQGRQVFAAFASEGFRGEHVRR